MTYREGEENLALLKRAVGGVRDFSGRSRRTELLYYIIATGLFGTVLKFTLSTLLEPKAAMMLEELWECLIMLPLFALFGRRLHDQDRTAWWVLLLVFAVAIGLFQSWSELTMSAEYPTRTPLPMPLAWIAVPVYIAMLCLFFLPGTAGANRFGDDPRLGDVVPTH